MMKVRVFKSQVLRSVKPKMWRSSPFIFALVALLAAAGTLGWVALPAPDPAHRQLQNLIKQKLDNPNDAKFRKEAVVVLDDGSKAMCVEVATRGGNHKYGGYKRIIATQKEVITEFSDVYDTAFVSSWANICIYHYANPPADNGERDLISEP